MTGSTSILGYCPGCGESIPGSHVLIEYETGSGKACYAECPACQDVVHPSDEQSPL